MKVPRALIGKCLEITWQDPAANPKRVSQRRAPKGIAALGRWREYGVVDDITDGVVRVVHSFGEDPPGDPEPEPEIFFTVVVEDLITGYRVLEPVPVEVKPNA